jgi:hypothetical protein
MAQLKTQDSQRFQAALDRIESLGGHCVFDGTLQAAVLANTGVTDDDLNLFRDLPSVQILDLSHTNVTDAGLDRLAHLSEVEELVLINTKVSEQAIEAFRRAHPTVNVTTQPPTAPVMNPFTGKPF